MQNSRVVDIFLELVRIDSPSGAESQVAIYIKDFLKKLHLESEIDSAGNVFAAVHPGGPNPVVINAHMDTVEPGRGIKPVVENGLIKSDGSTILGADNKVALAAILAALEQADQEKLRNLELVFSVREETDGGISEFDFAKLKSRTGLVADRASAIGSIVLSSPWIVNLNISVIGHPSHAGLPEQAVNALTITAAALTRTKWGRLDDKTTANIGLIQGGSAMNTVPGKVDLVGEVRSFSAANKTAALEKITTTFRETAAEFGAAVEITVSDYCSGYSYAQTDSHVQEIVKCMGKQQITANFEQAFGASDANTFAAHGIKLVNIGDGCKEPHTVNESIAVSDLHRLFELVLAYMTSTS